ncbi:MAG TPA: hypothetical protein VK550_19235 [Polyangiaceae bacterium]|nr:hypothetical protein [Polyangiaceae bacterium]
MGAQATILRSSSRRRYAVVGAAGAAWLTAVGIGPARATDDVGSALAPVGEPTDTVESTPPVEDGAATAVLPLTAAPFADDRKAQVRATSLFDDARKRTISEARADMRLFGPLSLHGGAFTAMGNGYVSPLVGAQVRALSQDRHFVDGAFSVSYLGEGFNLVRAAELRALVGRHFGDTSLYMNAGYTQGLERNERYIDLRVSAQQRFWDRRLFVGLDSRLRVDAERDADEPEHEPETDLLAGPVVGLTLGNVALSGFGGVSAVRYRDQSPSRAGAFAGIGIGAVLF